MLQNASAFITAKRSFKGNDGVKRTAEIADTRYGVIFTGEKFPNGRKADAVYILLHDSYRDVLDAAPTRPLDYDYLKELTPGAQRFYELLSFQIFAALKHQRPHAKMLYSHYCTRAPQTRYFDYDHVKKQMYKLHTPHRKSEYIAAVEMKATTDGEGQPDWEMLYTPGRKAKSEFKGFNEPSCTTTKKLKNPERPALSSSVAPEEPTPVTTMREIVPDDEPLVAKLVSLRVADTAARELVRDYRKSVELQLHALPHRTLDKIKDLAAWLVVAIKENHQLPETVAKSIAKEEATREAKAKREAQESENSLIEARQKAYFDFLRVRVGQTEKAQPEAFLAFINGESVKRAGIESDPAHKGAAKKIHLRLFDDEQSHLERFRDFFGEPNLEDW